MKFFPGTTQRIALRHITTRPASSAVTMITAVAVCGVAVATAAIICVLSVFNGFREFLTDNNNRFIPDVEITPHKGKVFENSSDLLKRVAVIKGVASARESLTDNALVIYQGREMPITLKGVDTRKWRAAYCIDSVMIGESRFISPSQDNGVTEAALSIGVANRLRFYDPAEKILLFAPRRHGRYNPANPAMAFIADSLTVTGVYQTLRSEMDENMIISDISLARRLFSYDDCSSEIEVTADKGVSPSNLADRIREKLGKGYVVRDRMQQQQLNFRMVNIEKWVSALLLLFILLIASFNIISSMSMVILEKQNTFPVLRALGMTRRGVGNIYGWESLYVTMAGGASGVVLGVLLVWLQSRYGLIGFSGDIESMILRAYPVKLEITDILATIGAVGVIGGITAAVAASFARSRA